MTGALITAEVDFDAEGKQSGYLRVPHSTHRSAYGWLPVPITVVRNGDGPTLVISAGVHGDEFEGQIAVANLARELDVAEIRGRLILLPMVNFPAAEAGCRVSPLDDGNLNRLYPGDPKGTPSEMIAHYHEEVVLPLADYAVDLHSGGSSLIYPPTLLRGPAHSPEEEAGLATLTEAFDLPYAWVFTGGGGRSSTARTAMGAANRKGVVNVMAELGGAGCVTRDVLRQTERGLRRILHAVGVLPDYIMDRAQGTRALHALGSIYADGSGVFEPLKTIGEDVAENETVALIHHPETPGLEPDAVISPYGGLVLAMRSMAQVRRGDALFQIAADAV
jgi:predicted deacylase